MCVNVCVGVGEWMDGWMDGWMKRSYSGTEGLGLV